MNLRIAILALAAACSAAETRVQLDLQVAPGLELESVQLRVGSRSAIAEPHTTLDLVLPDEMAGSETVIEVWGMKGGRQVAYGTSMVTPVLHGRVASTIELASITCGTVCQPGAIACASAGGVDGTITCEQREDGCTSWGELVACDAAAPFCSSGECASECADECTTDETTCDTAFTVRSCGQHDADACLDWSPPAECTNGETCTGGACGAPSPCANTGDTCDDGNACTEQDRCSSPGVCSGDPIVCDAAPAPTCVSQHVKRTSAGACTGGGCVYSDVDTACPYGCRDGACIAGQLAIMYRASCALDSQSEIRCWGVTSAASPPAGTFTQIEGGDDHGCGVRSDGTVACWGENDDGQTTAPAGTFKQVSAGGRTSCGLRTNGSLECWGNSTQGLLTEPSGTFVQVSVGHDHACAIRSDHTLACWGTGAPTSTELFASISVNTNQYIHDHTCGIKLDGWLVCWGSLLDEPPSGQFAAVSVGTTFACAREYDDELRCWGLNTTNGQLIAPFGKFIALASGEFHSCAIKATGVADCWGLNDYGQATPPAL